MAKINGPKEMPQNEAAVVNTAVSNTPRTFEQATRRNNNIVYTKEDARKKLGRVYAGENKVDVIIAPMYRSYFGRNMHVSVNGISIAVPCDGRPYKIPKTFAAVVQSRLQAINRMDAKKERFAAVANNVENTPGELPLY